MPSPSWSATVDGRTVQAEVPANASLAEALRAAGALEVKLGCGEGTCGACSVLLDGVHVHSCVYPALRTEGAQILTAASFADGPVARALVEHGGLQCGFCSPGVVVGVHALAEDRSVAADPAALREALPGNLCRCTGYGQLYEGAAAGLAALREEIDP